MFLFKLTLPVLGTATLGAVGTGIYYGVESWKNNIKKTKPEKETKKGEKGSQPTTSPEETDAPSPETQSYQASVSVGFDQIK